MTRVGYKYVSAHTPSADIDSDVAEYAATMEYRPGRFPSPEAFLAAHDQRWVRELHDVLSQLLDPRRRVLGIGSGEGEHEVLLHNAGFNVAASDVVPGVLDDAARLFPGMPVYHLDVFSDVEVVADDILATGLDFYFDDATTARLFGAVRRRLSPGGRFVFVLRYRDNAATYVIDRVGIPALAATRRARGAQLIRKAHGYRRSIAEIEAISGAAGFELGMVRYAAFAMELERLVPAPRPIIRLDERLHVLNSATVFELVAT